MSLNSSGLSCTGRCKSLGNLAGRENRLLKSAMKVASRGICGLNAGYTFQTHFFDQPILKCLIRTFHAAFSFRAVGTNKLDCRS